MTALVTFWGLRLSYNFYRKGGYNPLSPGRERKISDGRFSGRIPC